MTSVSTNSIFGHANASEEALDVFTQTVWWSWGHLVLIRQIRSNVWFIQKQSKWLLSSWTGVRESLTHLIRLKTWIHSVTKHRCVARRHKTVLSKIEQKKSILCLKCKSLNFNFLFIELLLYKITLQSYWNISVVQCCIPKSYIIIFFFYYHSMCVL